VLGCCAEGPATLSPGKTLVLAKGAERCGRVRRLYECARGAETDAGGCERGVSGGEESGEREKSGENDGGEGGCEIAQKIGAKRRKGTSRRSSSRRMKPEPLAVGSKNDTS
jgi:hypothetical protein